MKNKTSFLSSLFSMMVFLLFSCNTEDISIAPHEEAASTSKLIEKGKDIPIEAIFYNECCAEEVSVFGIAHVVVTDQIIHTVVQDITGTGLSTNYSYTNKGASVETNVFYSNFFEGTLIFRLNMDNDDGCSFKMNVTLHLSVSANGDVAADIQHITTDCE